MKEILKSIMNQLIQQANQHQISRLVVGAVITKGDKILCLKRAANDFMPGIYELPSGKVKMSETLEQTLMREVAEETNLKLEEITDYLGYFDYQSRTGALTRQFNFLIRCDQSHHILLNSAEHEGYTWVGQNEVNNYNISIEVKKVIMLYQLRRTIPVSTLELTQQAISEGIQRFVVAAVVNKDNKALILKRASHDFMGGMDELPSGKVNPNEALEIALKRELQEETGLDLAQINGYLGHFDYESKTGVRTRQFTFSVEVISTTRITISQEHEGFAWISSAELSRYQLSHEVKSLLTDFFPKPAIIENSKTVEFFSNPKKRKVADDVPEDAIPTALKMVDYKSVENSDQSKAHQFRK